MVLAQIVTVAVVTFAYSCLCQHNNVPLVLVMETLMVTLKDGARPVLSSVLLTDAKTVPRFAHVCNTAQSPPLQLGAGHESVSSVS